ncbi:MAG: helix-turn-helix domain-containing protein [Candidatus Bathyarchaeia archaeon]
MKKVSPELENKAREGATLTTSEASRLTGYDRDHLSLLARRGVVRGSRRGRDWFIHAGSLLQYIQSQPRPGRKGR